MADSTAGALQTATLCNTLLDAIDRLETMVEQSSDATTSREYQRQVKAMGEWILDARGLVLDIKCRL